MVLGSARGDKNEFSESNLHVCSRDGTKAEIYNMERCTKRGEEHKKQKKTGTLVQFDYSTKPYHTYYLDYSEDRFSNLNCVLQSKTTKSNRFSSGIDLVLPSTLYKFIVWATWV